MTKWELLHPQMTMDHLGYIPDFLSEHDSRPAAQQFDSNYAHGGGWNPEVGRGQWKMLDGHKLKYPGDPVLYAACANAASPGIDHLLSSRDRGDCSARRVVRSFASGLTPCPSTQRT